MKNSHFYWDDELTEEEIEEQEEWKKYVSNVDKLDREAQLQRRALTATVLIIVIIIIILVVFGRTIADIIS